MDGLPEVQGLIEKLSGQIDEASTHLEPFLETKLSEQRFETFEDQAKFCAFLAYALDSTMFAYLKARGKDTNDHPIMKELDRVKSYMAKIKEAQKTRPKVDKAAADRFIRGALAGNPQVESDNFLKKMAKETNKRTHDDVEGTEPNDLTPNEVQESVGDTEKASEPPKSKTNKKQKAKKRTKKSQR